MDFAAARECRLHLCVPVPMRDGVRLATSVFLPKADGPHPVVLVRTAYNRAGMSPLPFVERGLALVVQDCRGRYGSGGRYYPFVHEGEDGHDTLEWIGRQPWCSGAVGMFGDSYLAATQFYAAPLGSPFLKALNPRFMAIDPWQRAYYCDGAFSLALTWSWLCFECRGRTSEAASMPLLDVRSLLGHLPLATLDQASGCGVARAYRDYVTRPRWDEGWAALSLRKRYAHFGAPALLTGGWYDYYPAQATDAFTGLREKAPTPQLRDSHRLLLGPWTHGVSAGTVLGEVDFGPQALAENDATLRWLDCLLHGRDPAEFQRAPVRLFVMGLNQWRDEGEWPLARTRYVPWYLQAGGGLDSEPPGPSAPDCYAYDPDGPVPTLGGNHSVGPYNPGLYDFVKPGPFDQRPVEERADVLVYTSQPLPRDVEVTGPVRLRLCAASSAPDTDFVARLTDVLPDGRSLNIAEGVIRARFRRDLWGPPRLLEPGRVYDYLVNLQVTSNLFRRGHRIRLQVTSSNFPLWDRNRNTGEDPATDTGGCPAEQSIYHDAQHPSHLLLPVVSP
ncbi:MAG: CocE/NonD family hydrolase [Candidatus Latescibacterota bacterium]